MKRKDITNTTKDKINEILKQHEKESLINMVIENIYLNGDILDFNKEVKKPKVEVKFNDIFDFFDNNKTIEELMEEVNEEFKEVQDFEIIAVQNESLGSIEITSFIRQNLLRYKEDLKYIEEPNIFNNEDLRVLFQKLANDQRNKPEDEMRKAQDTMGGGQLPHLLEHVGDLTHRMAQSLYISTGDVHLSLTDIIPKIEMSLSILKKGDDFKLEVDRNRLSNFNHYSKKDDYKYKTFEKYEKQCLEHLEKYSKEHSKLTVYNDLQHAAKYAAVHLGNGEYKKAYESIKILDDAIKNGSYCKRASMYKKDYETQSLKLVLNNMNSKYYKELDKLIITEKSNVLTLHDIRVNENYRDEGIGTEIMKEIIKYAKLNNSKIVLTPNDKDPKYGTKSKSKLIKFYKSLGFEENKGRKRDFEFNQGTMIFDNNKPKNKNKLK